MKNGGKRNAKGGEREEEEEKASGGQRQQGKWVATPLGVLLLLNLSLSLLMHRVRASSA